MTNQEVAKSLKNIRDLYPWGEDSYKTLDYAIRAVIELPKRRKEAKRWRAKAHQIAGESYENGYLAGQKNVAERCEDAISRQAVIDACEQSINILEAVDRIMDLPSVEQEPKTEQEDDYFRKIVEVAISQLRADRDRLEDELAKREQEPKTGHWIKSRDCYGNHHFTCSECGNDIATQYADNWEDKYCSECGCRMFEPQERSDKE